MRIYFQILVNGSSAGEGSFPTIVLQTVRQKYLFNCGENFMRFQKYHRVKCTMGMIFFLTRLSSPTCDGLHPNLTNLFGTGVALSDRIYGPSNTVAMFQEMKQKYYIKLLPYSLHSFSTGKEVIPSIERDRDQRYLLGVRDMNQIFSLANDLQFPHHYFESAQSANEFIAKQFSHNVNLINDSRDNFKQSDEGEFYEDSEVRVRPIAVEGDDTLAYLVEFPEPKRKMNKEKLKSLNIPNNLMKEFQEKQQIKLNGRVISIEEVLEEELPAERVLVFDCANAKCLSGIMEFARTHTGLFKQINAVIHVAEIELLRSLTYQEFTTYFNDSCEHIFVSDRLGEKTKSNEGALTFPHLAANLEISSEFPLEFPKIVQTTTTAVDVEDIFKDVKRKHIAKVNYELLMNTGRGGDKDKYVPSGNASFSTKKQMGLAWDEFKKAAGDAKKTIDNELPTDEEFKRLSTAIEAATKDFNPHVYFLGTTCMMPTTFRNNSSIFIHEKKLHTGIMLDCGEGTLLQMQNQLGAQFADALIDLKLLVITHAHSDHYLGFQSVIYARSKVIESRGITADLFLIIPWCLKPWFEALDTFYGKQACKVIYIQEFNGESILSLFSEYKKDEFEDEELIDQINNEEGGVAATIVQPCEVAVDTRSNKANVRAAQLVSKIQERVDIAAKEVQAFKDILSPYLHLQSLSLVPVEHCSQAYGVVFTTTNNLKISYSGDTRPSKVFAEAAKDSHLLIHEATFNEFLADHAKKARHSTVNEALEIARIVAPNALVLTHVSKRHSKLILPQATGDEQQDNLVKYRTALALDHLQFQLSSFYTVPLISKAAHAIFTDID